VDDLEHTAEAKPEEEHVDHGDHHGRDLVLSRADHHRREQRRRHALEMQPLLDTVGERMRVAVQVAAGNEHHRQHRHEEVCAQQHREQLAVGCLIPAHPADRRAPARFGVPDSRSRACRAR
jgi:hypothetical protein